ncbi:MAG: amino acid ABC transporter permease [Holosporales bacterium]|jgi:polar amino acid transport system permease protein|nr:amino acid ABC transporter permease [Holosporales bacterium]
MSNFFSSFLLIGTGLALTLKLLFGCFIIGLSLGTLLAILKFCKICVHVIDLFVSFLRGTPLLLQLSLIYFSVPGIFGVQLSVLSAGIIAFGINSSAYIAEILRAGIESIPNGQFEAAISLGIPKNRMWRDIIMPQVVKNILPALINEIVDLLKETALIATIGGMDIMRYSQIVGAAQFNYFAPLCIAAIYYYVLVSLITWISRLIERRTSYVKA